MQLVRTASPRWAAAGTLAVALPAAPLGVAAVGAGSASLGIIGGSAALLALLAAWVGPVALPGMGRAGAVERVIVTAVVAWAAAFDAAVAASALRRWGHRNVWRVADGGVADLLERPIGLDLLGAA